MFVILFYIFIFLLFKSINLKKTLKSCCLVLLFLLTLLIDSCKKDSAQLPTITTTQVTLITPTTASSGGNITSDNGGSIIVRGVCWSTSENPTTTNSKTEDGTGTGSFVSSITGLTAATTYYLKAYATNSAGTQYGSQISFTTEDPVSIEDVEGTSYKVVRIGTQLWMAENLKTTKYSNGDLIGTTSPATLNLAGLTGNTYQWAYDGDESNVATYGRLYSGYAVLDIRKVCPIGWHVPSNDEWSILATYLGGLNVAGGKLKETGTTHWLIPNTGATNETGFTALPSGSRSMFGVFEGVGQYANFWSSSEVNDLNITVWGVANTVAEIGNFFPLNKSGGSPVRCLKDN